MRAFRATLTEGPVGPVLARLALPMAWGILAILSFNLADTYFVGRLGTRELAAMSFTFPVVAAIGSLALGLGVGATSVISRAVGEGDPARVRRLATDSLTLSFLIVLVFVLLGLATIDPLFAALGAGPELRPLVAEYMRVWYVGMVFLVVPMVGNSAIRAAGDTLVPSLIMTFAALLNVVLDPLLIFGLWGFPAMGLRGAAVATVLARALTMAASLAILRWRENMLAHPWPGGAELLRSWRKILEVGVPAAAMNTVIPIGSGVVTRIVAGYGPEAVAAFGVATRIENFSLIVLMALSSGLGPFVGQNWGGGHLRRVREGVRLAYRFSLAWGLVAALALAALAEPLAALFSPQAEVVRLAARYLRIVPAGYAAAGVMMVTISTFNAVGRPLAALSLTLAEMACLYVPAAYLLSWWLGLDGVFVGGLAAFLGAGAASYLWSRRLLAEPGEP